VDSRPGHVRSPFGDPSLRRLGSAASRLTLHHSVHIHQSARREQHADMGFPTKALAASSGSSAFQHGVTAFPAPLWPSQFRGAVESGEQPYIYTENPSSVRILFWTFARSHSLHSVRVCAAAMRNFLMDI